MAVAPAGQGAVVAPSPQVAPFPSAPYTSAFSISPQAYAPSATFSVPSQPPAQPQPAFQFGHAVAQPGMVPAAPPGYTQTITYTPTAVMQATR